MIAVSIIVPAYKDDKRLNDCCVRLNGLPKNYEWLVASEKGKGKAIDNAVQRARGKIVVTCDTDFTATKYIPKYVEEYRKSKADILIGKRVTVDKPLSRRVSSSLYNFGKQVLFGKLPDTQSGFKIFGKQQFLDLSPFKIEGYAWDTEFVSKAKEQGYKIVETKVYNCYSKGTIHQSDGIKMGFDLLKLWLANKINLLLFAVSLVYLIGLILASTLTSIPIGTDIHFHYDVARQYSIGKFGMFSDIVFETNLFPYPPIFHVLLVPSIWLNIEYIFAKLLQIVLPFLIYASTVIFMRYHTNQKTALITALLLTSTVGFVDGTIQARPQGLTMIFIPIALHMYLRNNSNGYAIFSGALAYIHGAAGLVNVWLLSLYGFTKKHWKGTFIKLALIVSPIILITVYFFGGAISKWGGVMDTYQEYLVFTQPQTMIPYYSGMTLIGWVYLAYNMTRWDKLSPLEKTLCLSLIGLTVMIPIWVDRFLQYATITLSCLSAVGINKSKRAQQIILPLLAIMCALVMINVYWITFTNNWWLYPQ